MAETAEIRQWASTQGLKVGSRGRIHPDIQAAYEKAHAAAPTKHRRKRSKDILPKEEPPKPEVGAGGRMWIDETNFLGSHPCGFCAIVSDSQHYYCPGTIRQASGVWNCPCAYNGHKC